jgi:hypothetical protein
MVQTAQVLIGLWSEQPRLLPDAESQIQKDLEGWFRYRALAKLYQLQQRQEAQLSLQAKEQELAEQGYFQISANWGNTRIRWTIRGGTFRLFNRAATPTRQRITPRYQQ